MITKRLTHMILPIAGLIALLLAAGVVIGQSDGRDPAGQAETRTAAITSAVQSATTFTYQGHLDDAMGPVTDTCDMSFKLFEEGRFGNQVGSTQLKTGSDAVVVKDGIFTVELDFGLVFDGSDLYLELCVFCPSEGQPNPSFETITPRQRLAAAPYAFYSHIAPWSGLTGVPAEFADNIDNVSEDRSQPPGLTIMSTVDDLSGAGEYLSITIGTDGNPIISYYDAAESALKVAHCHDPDCRDYRTFTVDDQGDVGKYSSIIIGADGNPLISYYEGHEALKVAHCNNPNCGSATTHRFDIVNSNGQGSSITIGADGLGLISTHADGDLLIAHCIDIICSDVTTARQWVCFK